MLLDTGASITTIDESVVEQLGTSGGKTSAIIVAGGGIHKTKLVTVHQMKVGPKLVKNPEIMVLKQNTGFLGFQGLLGQDFLRQFSFTIDYGNNVIRWGE